ncbi:UNVERIFIED_CONTAM: Photosystem II protein D1 [Sesamum radiatum]|uniref:Photosystem II protein D1 n=1 Tax=Sesamum radiatum TaxID=300843 RepID=A0AAW2JAH0_SESRA
MVFVNLFLDLTYGNNIIFRCHYSYISAAIGLHFYPIWDSSIVDECSYNGGPYELIVLHFLLGVACYMGREWELSFRLGMPPLDCCWAYSAPVALLPLFFDLPNRSRSFLMVCSRISGKPPENDLLMEGLQIRSEKKLINIVAAHGYFGRRLIFQYASSTNSSFRYHFFLAAWPVRWVSGSLL